MRRRAEGAVPAISSFDRLRMRLVCWTNRKILILSLSKDETRARPSAVPHWK
jgi:hypothetical protein